MTLAKCSKCGFEFEKGTDGIHDCVEVLRERNKRLELTLKVCAITASLILRGDEDIKKLKHMKEMIRKALEGEDGE
tara:strand:- start:8693 stop:8920 length:228 start_codon:yes stop_codon:yes gene_type:complete